MYLKTLTLRGFKSFASATTLSFEPGITCVVGPNGSGKSNVVDALSWVMGEQGAKTLRGGAMADVIFAGTSQRAPLGRAEVSLTIDNSDGLLPIEYTEVTISRTLFRQGNSEYAINGTACRLLDIQELLSDTGLGKEMHVIVGQGRLDSVLSATPEERRGFIEEAAGILKHRRRKEKALRKLDSMGANLARLTDLTGEIRRQLGPLAKQADVARRAGKIQSDLRDANARLLADDYVQLTTTLEQVLADDSALREQLGNVELKIGELTASIEELEQENLTAAPQLTEMTQMWYQLSSLKERMRSTATVASERHRHVSQAAQEPAKGGRDPEDLARQAASLRKAEAELATELEQARQSLDQAVAHRQECEQRAGQTERELSSLHRGIADRREGVAKLSGKVAGANSRLEATMAELERLRQTISQGQERSDHAAQLHANAEQELALFEEESADGDSGFDAATQDLALAQELVATLSDEHRQAREEVASWQARLSALRMSAEAKDAMAGLRKLETSVATGMAEMLRVQPKYASAIAVALGTLADAAVAPDLGAAVRALQVARSQDLGMARMVLGNPNHTGDLASVLAEKPEAPAGSMWALEVLDADPSLVPALTTLLAHVVIADDDAAAQQLTAEHGLTAVTLEGTLYAPTHVVGGSEVEQNLLHLHSAIEEATHRLAAAQSRVAELQEQLKPAKERVQRCQELVSQAERDRQSHVARTSELQRELARHLATFNATQAELERSRTEEIRSLESKERHETELAQLRADLVAAEQEPHVAQENLATAQTLRDEAAQAATQARGKETDARLVLRTLEERTRALGGRAESLERAAETERRAQQLAQARAQKLAQQAHMAAFVRDSATSVLVRVDESLARATQERLQMEALKASQDEKLQTFRQELTQWQNQFRELSDVVHRDDLAKAEQRLRIEQLQDRVMQELGLDTDTLVDEFGPHLMVPVFTDDDESPQHVPYVRSDQEKRLKAAQRGLTLLGKVNPLALEEHAALEERHQFLSEQLADLKKSRGDLLTIVQEIDERVETVFTEAFADTAVEFEKVFQVLFPGGEGRLVLTDPSDMLTTGIEVEARPAGKKVKRLSLLSGGERSLTAIALLVAIFKARPSPFYVMDEVEAALDDVNLGRLLTILRELRQDSQLIVITHQKRTMEIADALYGVTMRGDGVTTVISQRLSEES